MIINAVREVQSRDLRHFAWSGLRQFQNVGFTINKINQLQSPPLSQAKNVKKQAQQIRYCLIQAEEYFRAAKVVSQPTKPLLLYYGVMSLALAEILLKQTGNSSLDRARGQHAHHGLDLRLDGRACDRDKLRDSARCLRAVPLIRGNERFGTFELWHRTSRESPMAGELKTTLVNGAVQTSLESLASGSDERLSLVPDEGISLLDCLRHHPLMRDILYSHRVKPATCRGALFFDRNDKDSKSLYKIILHPDNPDVLAKTYERFLFNVSALEDVNVIELPAGAIITMAQRYDDPHYPSKFAYGFQIQPDEVHFSSELDCLNEFGLLYAGLYILGNYARYFPDQWMVEVEASSALALATNEFMTIAELRAPLLCYSELSQIWHLASY